MDTYKANILKIPIEVINQLKPIHYEGNITVIDNKVDLIEVCSFLKKQSRIGFDTESRPAFRKGQVFPVSIVQIATEDKAYIFQLKKIGFTEEIKSILSDNNIEKIGVGLHDDIRRLKRMGNFEPSGFIDLAEIAKKKGLIQCGLRALTARYLNRKLIKTAQKTNWAKSGLSERQLRYAATDAWICLFLLKPLLEDNTDYFEIKRQLDEEMARENIEDSPIE